MSISITVIGYGNVGRVLTNLLLGSNLPMDLNILDPADRLKGAFLDLTHAQGLQPEKKIYFNDFSVFERSDFVFFTAGVPGKHGDSRLSTVDDNVQLVREVFEGKNLQNDMRIIAITNPVDVITAAIISATSLPKNQVVGTGTYLDSQRFSYHLADLAQVNVHDVDALILGEHGDSCVPILSHSSYRNTPILESELFTETIFEKAFDQTLHAAYEIRKTEPGTSMAVSHCALRLMEAWMQPEEIILPVSTVLNPEHVKWLDLKHAICMSLPVGVSQSGIRQLEPLELSSSELKALQQSAHVLLDHQGFMENLNGA